MKEKFGLFILDGKGPLDRCGANDLAEARRKAQEIAATENVECFIYSFEEVREIERFYPPASKAGGKNANR